MELTKNEHIMLELCKEMIRRGEGQPLYHASALEYVDIAYKMARSIVEKADRLY